MCVRVQFSNQKLSVGTFLLDFSLISVSQIHLKYMPTWAYNSIITPLRSYNSWHSNALHKKYILNRILCKGGVCELRMIWFVPASNYQPWRLMTYLSYTDKTGLMWRNEPRHNCASLYIHCGGIFLFLVPQTNLKPLTPLVPGPFIKAAPVKIQLIILIFPA